MNRFCAVVLAAVCVGPVAEQARGAERIDVKGFIGCHEVSFGAVQIERSSTFKLDARADWVAITEVYPDTPEPVRYRYDVFIDGRLAGRREHESTGFGPVTWFAPAPQGRADRVLLVDRSAGPDSRLIVAGVRSVTRQDLDAVLRTDSFAIMRLVPPQVGDEAKDEFARQLAANLRERPAYGIRRGFSYEIRYANHTPELVREQVERCERWAREHALPAVLGLVSWWSGTPVRVPDGTGGNFGDVTYQQVCYSPEVESPEDEGLRQLLGVRYTPNYGLSVPNQWSSCPWLTMNSQRLNEYRFSRISEAVGIMSGSGAGRWLHGLYLENEPRYWDTDCEAGNPKAGGQGKTLWADLNPVAVADARQDGVDLDPTDGLSHDELSWLHRNVGRYNQDIVSAVLAALLHNGFEPDLPVYTHSLQHRDMFPGGEIRHPASEWAYAQGARTGLEGLWSQPSDFERVREWGHWANVNREENDGRHIDEHLWDLRVAYMMGGDLYNSYNWHAIGARRFFDYVDEFLAEFPVVRLAPAEMARTGPRSMMLKTPMKLQAFDRVELPVETREGFEGEAFLTVTGDDGRVIGLAGRQIALTAGEQSIAFDFPTPIESSCRA